MESNICTEPVDLVHIDYVSMEVTVGVKEKLVMKNVLVIEDHFMRYTQAYVMNNHMVGMLYNEFFLVFGFPWWLMSDQAAEFTGQVISELWFIGCYKDLDVTLQPPRWNGNSPSKFTRHSE